MNIAHALAPFHPASPSAVDEIDDVPPRGCGWFDSSHELRAGLSITEHDGADAIANELALDVWLFWHLAGRAPRPAARASSGS